MIDLIALDLDGTLLDSSGEISARNRSAIRAALESGIRIVLVTGRGVATPIRIARELGLNLPIICCHGALTKDFTANRTLGHIPVPLQYAKPIVEFGEQNALALAIYVEESFYWLEGPSTGSGQADLCCSKLPLARVGSVSRVSRTCCTLRRR